MKKFLALILTAVFMISALSLIGCAPSEPTDPAEPPQAQTPIITLSMSSPMSVTTETGETYIEKTLTATVTPDSATNKLVDWSIEWFDSSIELAVTDYVTVTPAEDGSTTAYVRCYQPFSGTITITVTTRESGLQDYCSVTYEGLASELIISGDIAASGMYYYFGSGVSYTFNISLNNIFGKVSEKFYDSLLCETSAVGGSIVVADWKRYSDNSREWVNGTEKTIEINSIKDKYITANIQNETLTIKATFYFSSYYESIEEMSDYKLYKNKFKSIEDGNWYFVVTITDLYTNLKQELKIKQNENAVENVSLNKANIIF